MTLAYRHANGTLVVGGWRCEVCGEDRRFAVRDHSWVCLQCQTEVAAPSQRNVVRTTTEQYGGSS